MSGFVGIVIDVPAPLIFWRYGTKPRSESRYAAGQERVRLTLCIANYDLSGKDQ